MDFNRSTSEEERLKALRRERFNNTEGEHRYSQLVSARTKRRQQLTEQGMLSRGGSLTEARKLVGTCMQMCPDFEREERELKKNLAPQEVIPGTQKADASKTVKTFHRSAAGNEEPLPEDLRTPDALLRTLDYLVDRVIGEDQTLKSCHGFVRDRTRSIRQDFTIQNIRDQHTVAACERIARFHIVSLHILCGHKDFAEQQDMEQLRNTLKTLIELYDDHRKVGAECPNEAEFYAYYIVSHLRDSDAKRVAERLPASIFLAPIVQQALRLHMLSESSNVVTSRQDPGNLFAAQNMSTQFFRAVASPQTPLLLACLAEYRFPSIRRAALKAMNTAFPYQEGKEYPVEEFAAMLAFDSTQEVVEFCALFGVSVNARGVCLGQRDGKRLVFREPAQKLTRSARNLRVVGSKFHTTPMHAINSTLEPRFLAPTALSYRTQGSSAAGPPQLAQRNSLFSNGAVAPASASALAPALFKPAPAGSGFARPPLHPGLSGQKPASIFANNQQQQANGNVFGRISTQPVSSFGSNTVEPASTPVSAFGFNQSNAGPLSAEPPAQSSETTAPFVGQNSAAPSLFSSLGAKSTSTTSGNKMQKSVSFAPLTFSTSAPAPSAGSSSLFQSPALSAPSFAAPTATTATATTTESKPEPVASNISVATVAPKLAVPAPAPAVPSVPAVASVVWNKPRPRINWTSLSNTLYADLIESLVGEVAQPIAERAKQHSEVAVTLANDIAESIINYTSAFVAYEESYRCLTIAQADSFRRKTMLRRIISQWGMETVAKQQDRALHQQYIDELDRLVDTEYIGQSRAFAHAAIGTMPKHIGTLNCLESAADGPYYHGLDLDVDLDKLPVAMPADFWESLHLGRECFDSVRGALKRYGNPSLSAVVEVSGAQEESVLSSWLWWQIDPAAASLATGKTVVYTSGVSGGYTIANTQSLEFSENADTTPSALVVQLSSEPITASDVHGDLESSDAGRKIVSLVNGALVRLCLDTPAKRSGSTPLLFVFWSDDARATRAVQRLIEQTVDMSSAPPPECMHTLALDVALAKGQFAAGMRWLAKQIALARCDSLVKVSRAFGPVSDASLQTLRRIHGCVMGLLGDDNGNDHAVVAVFNMAVDAVNLFIGVINEHLLESLDCPRAAKFSHASETGGISREYFGKQLAGGLSFVSNAVARASLAEILSGGNNASEPSLGACLRALEFALKHQLDYLHQSIPSSAPYVDKSAIADAMKGALQAADNLVTRIARTCQQNQYDSRDASMFTTPTMKRTSHMELDMSAPPPTLNLFATPRIFRITPTTPASSATSDQLTLSTNKRRRADALPQLSRLQIAMERARRHLN
ncbi:actin cytoskeleton and mitosis protein [Kickxella alabastrina]|uniref:Actin cytoskeleton and mitosis protein n=1 Tax=Kickxella alabastrina TaxID=61397 RepID=A0ACC1IIZ0_9FUNG|nr:actin cytoskeleton and mitosis protein [Kickxella alabastrina]